MMVLHGLSKEREAVLVHSLVVNINLLPTFQDPHYLSEVTLLAVEHQHLEQAHILLLKLISPDESLPTNGDRRSSWGT